MIDLTNIPMGCVVNQGSTVCLSVNGSSPSLPQAAASITGACGPFVNDTLSLAYNNVIDMGGMTLRYAFQSTNASSLGPMMGALLACGHTALSTITDPQLVASGFAKGFGAGAGTFFGLAAIITATFFGGRALCAKRSAEHVQLVEKEPSGVSFQQG